MAKSGTYFACEPQCALGGPVVGMWLGTRFQHIKYLGAGFLAARFGQVKAGPVLELVDYFWSRVAGTRVSMCCTLTVTPPKTISFWIWSSYDGLLRVVTSRGTV